MTDFAFGGKTLLYSTAEVLTYAIIDGKEVLALWVPTGESGEFTIDGVNSAKLTTCNGCANVSIIPGASNVTVSFMQNAGMSTVELADGSKVVLLDRSAAYLFWSPSLDNNPLTAGNDTGMRLNENYWPTTDTIQFLFKGHISSVPLPLRTTHFN